MESESGVKLGGGGEGCALTPLPHPLDIVPAHIFYIILLSPPSLISPPPPFQWRKVNKPPSLLSPPPPPPSSPILILHQKINDERRLISYGLFIKITEEHEIESTFLKDKNFVFVTFRLPQVN